MRINQEFFNEFKDKNNYTNKTIIGPYAEWNFSASDNSKADF